MLKDNKSDKTPTPFTVQAKIIMSILPKIIPPAVTNLSQRPFSLPSGLAPTKTFV
jgi:hypothetical protein